MSGCSGTPKRRSGVAWRWRKLAYRFNGTSDYLQFGIGPFSGYTVGPFTVATLLKRNSAATAQTMPVWSTNVPGLRLRKFFQATNVLRWGGSGNINGPTLTSTSVWYLIVLTRGSGTVTPRWHIWDGTAWAHSDGSTTSADVTIASTDLLRFGKLDIGTPTDFLAADVVCTGAKKADSNDATVQTLSPTSFAAWAAFGFDWLIGFDTSLTSAGVLQDQASPGTGDEISRSGTTLVADPPGWTWGGAAPTTPKSGFLAFL
jgi:hypothetical protein